MTISNAFTKTFGNAYKNYKGDIGLEIETESKDEYRVPKFSFWDVHVDGSLRGFGQEYVLKQPLDFDTTLNEALEEFRDKTKDIKFVQDSITTSVHVHLNLLNDNFITLGNFLTLYSFVENILIRFSGDDRLSNLFCLPICDAEETYHNIQKIVESLPKKRYGSLQFEVDSTKYGALNLSSLVRYGSLEVRSFRGTTDIRLIRDWVGILYSILRYARQKGLTPPDIIKTYKEKGSEILSEIFGEYRKLLRHKDEDSLLDQNLWYAVNIACGSVKDWTKIEDVPKIIKPKLKDLDKLAMEMYAVATFEALNFEQQQNILRRAEERVQPTTATPINEAGIDWAQLRGTPPRVGDTTMNPFRDVTLNTAQAARGEARGGTAPEGNRQLREDWEILYGPMDGFETVTWEGEDWELSPNEALCRHMRTRELNVFTARQLREMR